jgi:hypothetical protein
VESLCRFSNERTEQVHTRFLSGMNFCLILGFIRSALATPLWAREVEANGNTIEQIKCIRIDGASIISLTCLRSTTPGINHMIKKIIGKEYHSSQGIL